MKIRLILLAFILVGLTSNVQAKIMTKTISYQHDGLNLEGFLAYDDSLKGKRPAVLVVHEWWGLNDYARSRAEQLAGMGYIEEYISATTKKNGLEPKPADYYGGFLD